MVGPLVVLFVQCAHEGATCAIIDTVEEAVCLPDAEEVRDAIPLLGLTDAEGGGGLFAVGLGALPPGGELRFVEVGVAAPAAVFVAHEFDPHSILEPIDSWRLGPHCTRRKSRGYEHTRGRKIHRHPVSILRSTNGGAKFSSQNTTSMTKLEKRRQVSRKR